MNITLSRPKPELLSSYLECMEEMRSFGETVWEMTVPRNGETRQQFLQRLSDEEVSPLPGLVPQSSYWACDGDQVIGRIALRHVLNENLEEFGGHIGYEVRPSARRKGVAKEMLRLLLLLPKTREIGRLLLTCSPDNVGSNKTIIANGGVFSKTAFAKRVQRETNYYWITLEG